MQETQEMWVQSLGSEDPLERGHGNPLQYPCLENPMGRGTWQASVHRVTHSRARLKQLNTRAQVQTDLGVTALYPLEVSQLFEAILSLGHLQVGHGLLGVGTSPLLEPQEDWLLLT